MLAFCRAKTRVLIHGSLTSFSLITHAVHIYHASGKAYLAQAVAGADASDSATRVVRRKYIRGDKLYG